VREAVPWWVHTHTHTHTHTYTRTSTCTEEGIQQAAASSISSCALRTIHKKTNNIRSYIRIHLYRGGHPASSSLFDPINLTIAHFTEMARPLMGKSSNSPDQETAARYDLSTNGSAPNGGQNMDWMSKFDMAFLNFGGSGSKEDRESRKKRKKEKKLRKKKSKSEGEDGAADGEGALESSAREGTYDEATLSARLIKVMLCVCLLLFASVCLGWLMCMLYAYVSSHTKLHSHVYNTYSRSPLSLSLSLSLSL
jgi:hypothetical protein